MQTIHFETGISPNLGQLLAQLSSLSARCDPSADFSFVRGRLTTVKSYLTSHWNEPRLTNQVRVGIFNAIAAAIPLDEEEIIEDPSKVPTLFDLICSATTSHPRGPLAWPIEIPRKVFDASLTDLYQGSGKRICKDLRENVLASAMFHSWDNHSPDSRMRAWGCLEWARRSVMRLRNVWLQPPERPPPRAQAHLGVISSLLDCFLENTVHPSLSTRIGVWTKHSEQTLDRLSETVKKLYVLADQDVRPRLWTILSCFTLAWHNPGIRLITQQAINQELEQLLQRIKQGNLHAGEDAIPTLSELLVAVMKQTGSGTWETKLPRLVLDDALDDLWDGSGRQADSVRLRSDVKIARFYKYWYILTPQMRFDCIKVISQGETEIRKIRKRSLGVSARKVIKAACPKLETLNEIVEPAVILFPSDGSSPSPRVTPPEQHRVRQRSPHERASVLSRDHPGQAESSASATAGSRVPYEAGTITREEWLDWLDLSPSPR
ncbi:hypothetical protein JCM5350_005282 [Sporobolomyces pararoseus]